MTQDETLAAAFADFSESLTELQAISEQVAALPDSANKARVGARIAAGLDAADQSQSALMQIGAMARHFRRGDAIRIPGTAKTVAIRALKGGTVALGALCYEGKHFIAKQADPAAYQFMPGMLVGTAWATLGGLLDLFGDNHGA